MLYIYNNIVKYIYNSNIFKIHNNVILSYSTKLYFKLFCTNIHNLSYIYQYLLSCVERMGKVAPSVFSGVQSGGETAFEKPKPPSGSVFGK